jgi:hypothetical protein
MERRQHEEVRMVDVARVKSPEQCADDGFRRAIRRHSPIAI